MDTMSFEPELTQARADELIDAESPTDLRDTACLASQAKAIFCSSG